MIGFGEMWRKHKLFHLLIASNPWVGSYKNNHRRHWKETIQSDWPGYERKWKATKTKSLLSKRTDQGINLKYKLQKKVCSVEDLIYWVSRRVSVIMTSTVNFEETTANVSLERLETFTHLLRSLSKDDISTPNFKDYTAYKIRKFSIFFVKPYISCRRNKFLMELNFKK